MSATEERRQVSIEEAERRIAKGKYVHTFMQAGPAIVGADHARDEVIAAIKKHGVEDSGAAASAMGHTLVIVEYPVLPPGDTTALFIEAAPVDEVTE